MFLSVPTLQKDAILVEQKRSFDESAPMQSINLDMRNGCVTRVTKNRYFKTGISKPVWFHPKLRMTVHQGTCWGPAEVSLLSLIISPPERPLLARNTCTLCNKLYIGESGRKSGDRFREHLLDVKNKGSDLSKPVARHFNLPGHSHEHMEICGIYLHLGNNETRKRKEQRLIFKLGTLAPSGISEQFSFA